MSPWKIAGMVDGLKALWAKGASASQIAGELGNGLTRNSVISKIHRMGLVSPNSWTANNRGGAGGASKNTGARKPRQRNRHIEQNPQPIGPHGQPPDDALARYEQIDVNRPAGFECSIRDLSDQRCRWPIGHPTAPDFKYCGAGVKAKPYCAFHHRMAYSPPAARARRKA